MAYNFLKKERIFDCVKAIESLRCFQCANFETQKLADLWHHFKGGHTLPDSKAKFYECTSCTFQTYSKFLQARHKLLNLCINEEKIESEATKDLELIHFAKNKPKPETSKWHKCEHCEYASKKAANLKRHILVKHTGVDNIQWFECDHCSYKGKTKSNLKRHMAHHNDETAKFKCVYCKFQTDSKETLNNHIFVNHPKKCLECELCSYKSKRQSNLKVHMDYSHGKKTTLKCTHCQFKTQYNQSLESHNLAKHKDMIQWLECDHCSYKTTIKSRLDKHIDCKHGEKDNLKCDYCSFETRYQSVLKRHILVKHPHSGNIEWFFCAHCSYKTQIKTYVQQHLSRHRKWALRTT